MENYVYRALSDENIQEGIKCKDASSPMRLFRFLLTGSNTNSSFISSSKLISIAAEKYSPGTQRDFNNEDKKRSPVVLIDLDKLTKEQCPFYDCSTEEKLKELKGNTDIVGDDGELVKLKWSYICGHGVGDREVIIEKFIPVGCFKTIPPLLVDIMTTIEHWDHNSKWINSLNEKIMDDSIGDFIEKIMRIINGTETSVDVGGNVIKFSNIEKIFVDLYYDKMLSMHSIGKLLDMSMAENKSKITGFNVANSIKLGLIKKILMTSTFLEIIGRNNNDNIIENFGMLREIISNLDKHFIPEGYFASTQFHEGDRNKTKASGHLLLIHRICDTFGIKLQNNRSELLIPSDYKIEEKDNTIKFLLGFLKLIKEEENNRPDYERTKTIPSDILKIEESITIDVKELQKNIKNFSNNTGKKMKKRGKSDCKDVQGITKSLTENMTKKTNDGISQEDKGMIKDDKTKTENIPDEH